MGEDRANNNIGLTESQYGHDTAYWIDLADRRAASVNQAVAIIVNGEVRYIDGPQKETK